MALAANLRRGASRGESKRLVETVWQVDLGEEYPKFITTHPCRKRELVGEHEEIVKASGILDLRPVERRWRQGE